jgi:hypothetical protein
MNWRKGFFRIWIIFAVLWVAGAGYWVFTLPPRFDPRRPFTGGECDPKCIEINVQNVRWGYVHDVGWVLLPPLLFLAAGWCSAGLSLGSRRKIRTLPSAGGSSKGYLHDHLLRRDQTASFLFFHTASDQAVEAKFASRLRSLDRGEGACWIVLERIDARRHRR